MHTKEDAERWLGKKLNGVREFVSPNGNDFEALYLAQDWADENGYTVGSLERNQPIGIALDSEYVSKWRNLGQDKLLLDGVILCDEFGTRHARRITIYYQLVEDKTAGDVIKRFL